MSCQKDSTRLKTQARDLAPLTPPWHPQAFPASFPAARGLHFGLALCGWLAARGDADWRGLRCVINEVPRGGSLAAFSGGGFGWSSCQTYEAASCLTEHQLTQAHPKVTPSLSIFVGAGAPTCRCFGPLLGVRAWKSVNVQNLVFTPQGQCYGNLYISLGSFSQSPWRASTKARPLSNRDRFCFMSSDTLSYFSPQGLCTGCS